MSDKKTCRCFVQTNAGLRCAQYERGGYGRRHGQRRICKTTPKKKTKRR